MKVFLTGGSGLLGSHVAQRLRRNGHEVTALVRPGSDGSFLRQTGCALVEGDLGEPPRVLAAHMDGCEGVVHAAAHMYGGRSLSDVAAVNVEGTRRVLEGAEKAGVLQAVHVSSVAVYGNAPGILDETRSLDSALPAWDFYGRTKRGGEVVASEFQNKGRVGVTILRPPALYGERDRWLTPRTIRSLSRRVVPLLNGGRASFPVVYAGNLAQAVEMALEGHAVGEVVNVADDLHLTLRSFLRGFANEMGLNPRFVNIPGVLAQGVAAMLERVGFRVPGARDLSLKRMVRLASGGNPYSSKKARTVLGWKPPFTFEEALTRTGSWIRKGKQPDGSSKGSV